jgi:hypothetical protein
MKSVAVNYPHSTARAQLPPTVKRNIYNKIDGTTLDAVDGDEYTAEYPPDDQGERGNR